MQPQLQCVKYWQQHVMRRKRAPPCQRMQRKLLVCEREKCEKKSGELKTPRL
jgi:hypothetical protein